MKATTFFLAAAWALLAGCSSTPTGVFKRTAVDDEWRIHAREMVATSSAVPAGKARLYLFREHGMPLGACAFEVHIDNVRAVDLLTGEFIELDVQPGESTLHFRVGGMLCPPYSSNAIQVSAEAGKVFGVRFGVEGMLGFIRADQAALP